MLLAQAARLVDCVVARQNHASRRFDATIWRKYHGEMKRYRKCTHTLLAVLVGASALARSVQAQESASPPTEKREPPAAQSRPEQAKPGPRSPRTADEKSRLLKDLYAQLAAAESEQDSQRISGTIERLWSHSGSATISLLMGRANKALGQKDTTLALRMLDFVVRLAPDHAEAFNRRAFLHFTLNDYQAAVGDLRRTLALEPNHYKALEGLAQIWRQTGNKKGALNVVKQLIEVHPFASGAKQMLDELTREVEGQGI